MSRDNILKTIRQNKPEFTPLPKYLEVTDPKPGKELLEIFEKSLNQVGAEFIELSLNEEIDSYLSFHFPEVHQIGKNGFRDEYSANCSKEKLDQIDTIILEGHLGVAENGAIWLDDSDFPNRLVPFVAQMVIISLDSAKILSNMTEAYHKLNMAGTGFGVFISGPSKTADIEQSLVYGAHGPKSLLVVIY